MTAHPMHDEVRDRAGDCCEYCALPQSKSSARFCLDHIIARQHGGPTSLGNLALCCLRCNKFKGPNIAGIDPQTGALTPLFNRAGSLGRSTSSGKAL